MEKLITFKLIGPNGWIVDTDLRNLCQAVFGCNSDRSITGKQIKDVYPNFADGEKINFKLVVEKKYTQKQLDKLPESDGDIG